MKHLLLPLLLLLLPLFTIAQYRMEGGILLGTSTYQGDLAVPNIGTLQEANLAYGLHLRANINQHLSIRAVALQTKISGSDQNFDQLASRNFSFSTNINELSLLLEWNLLSNLTPNNRFTPYLFAGAGAAFTDPSPNFNSNDTDVPKNGVREDLNADYQTTRMVVPFGMGVKVGLSERLHLDLEAGLRPTFTDYLDGVSLSANPDKNDWYGILATSLNYVWNTADSDHDGIPDHKDMCPDAPGQGIHQGCPDTDVDGIPDKDDLCPTFPGTINGCPDSDEDGIVDHADQCPQEAGPASRGGCPQKDTDGDGIIDEEDACPDKIGPASRNGCPVIDTDRDGIADERDQCPEVAGSRANFGCPEERVPVKDIEVAPAVPSIQNLYFETNDAQLSSTHKNILDKAAHILATNSEYVLLIKGFTDNVGDNISNLQLSRSRAQSCFEYLLKKGISSSRMQYGGYGEKMPAAPNDIPSNRQLNRRVELVIQ